MNTQPLTRRIASFAAALACLALAGAGTAQAQSPAGGPPPARWSWTVTPYAWATDVGADVKLDGRTVVDKTIPVSDLLDDLDTIAQLRFEAQHGRLGVSMDVFDVNLSSATRGVAVPQGVGTLDLDSDAGMTIFDVAGLYDPDGDRQGLAFLCGTRILNERATIDATFAPPVGPSMPLRYDTNETTVDGLFGVRFSKRFARRFLWQMQADVSTGGTDYTWSTSPTLTCVMSRDGRYALTGGWRYMHVDFEDDAGVEPTMTLSGALLGLRLSF